MTARVKNPKKAGRPSKLARLDLDQIKAMASLGLTEEEIALVVGVTARTIGHWKKKPEFLQAIKEGKIKADMQVTRSLYEQAIGDADKKIWPNVIACIFWLKNRQPDRWREKVDHDVNQKLQVPTALDIRVIDIIEPAAGPGNGNGKDKGNGQGKK